MDDGTTVWLPYHPSRILVLGAADVAVLPVDNSVAGRVADVHHPLPESGLSIVAGYFPPIYVPAVPAGEIRVPLAGAGVRGPLRCVHD